MAARQANNGGSSKPAISESGLNFSMQLNKYDNILAHAQDGITGRAYRFGTWRTGYFDSCVREEE